MLVTSCSHTNQALPPPRERRSAQCVDRDGDAARNDVAEHHRQPALLATRRGGDEQRERRKTYRAVRSEYCAGVGGGTAERVTGDDRDRGHERRSEPTRHSYRDEQRTDGKQRDG